MGMQTVGKSIASGMWRRLPGGVRPLFLMLMVLILLTPMPSHSIEELQVIAPVKGSVLSPGDLLKVQWKFADSIQPFPVTIYLNHLDSEPDQRFEIGSNLQPDVDDLTKFDWFIPNSMPPGSYVVTLVNFNASIQASTGVFSIAALPQPMQIRILYPPKFAGPPLSMFDHGSTISIHWDFPVGYAAPVDLYLDMFSNSTLRESILIADAISPEPQPGSLVTGTYVWTIQAPADRVFPNAHYKIRAVAAGGVMGSSPDFFEITSVSTTPSALPTQTSNGDADGANFVQNGSFESTSTDHTFSE